MPTSAEVIRQRVAICVTTFRRPTGLARLLEALGRLCFHGTAPAIQVVVVDNDLQQSARGVCETAQSLLSYPVRYVMEPIRGIAQARNAAVRASLPHCDLVAFIDDDEVPDSWWLDELLRVQREYQADVVTGPVYPFFEGQVAPYIREGRFFDPPERETGTRLDRAFTGNVLTRAQVFRDMPTLFDVRLNLTGGEDVHFYRRVARAGYSIVWAKGARIDEWVPTSRTSVGYILRRAYRIGTTLAVCDRELGGRWSLAWLGFRACGSIAKTIVMLPFAAREGRRGALRSVREIALRIGYLAGTAGLGYEEYRTVQGA